MYYNFIRTPAIVKTGAGILGDIDNLLHVSHLYFSDKVLITQEFLYSVYKDSLERNVFCKVVFVKGGCVDEASVIMEQCKEIGRAHV